MPDPQPRESDRIHQLQGRLAKEPMSRLFLELAREHHEAGSLEEAARVCAAGLKIHTTWRSARVLLGKIYFDMGRMDEAKEQLEEVVRHAPDNLVARRILADICAEEGDLGGALDRYRALLAFSPDDAAVAGRIEALEAARSVVAQSGPVAAEPLATSTMAEIYARQGLPDKAIAILKEVLRSDPDNREVRARIEELAGPASPPTPALSPEDAMRRKKIVTLERWLASIQSGARA